MNMISTCRSCGDALENSSGICIQCNAIRETLRGCTPVVKVKILVGALKEALKELKL